MSTTSATSSNLTANLLALGRDIKLSHSVFALPFALLATFMAAASRAPWPFPLGEVGRGGLGEGPGMRPGAVQLILILLCMVSARTVAMTANRLIDARQDALNPRTKGRAIPSGRLDRRLAMLAALACAAAFIAACAGFGWLDGNWIPLELSPLVLAWLIGYSYTKRFTALCHLWLGMALAISPVAAALAIQPAFVGRPDVWLLAGMVACWVAGFDVLYALQDVDFDRQAGLHSLPSRLGVSPALWISRLLHVMALTDLIVLARISVSLGSAFTFGVALVAILLITEHAIVWRSSTRHLNVAFLTVNGFISLLLGGLGIFDILRQM